MAQPDTDRCLMSQEFVNLPYLIRELVLLFPESHRWRYWRRPVALVKILTLISLTTGIG